MDKSVDTALRGHFADGSSAVEQEANVDNEARQKNLFDLTQDFDLLFDAVEQDWQEQALCAQTDPEAFFPEKGGSTREAKRICQACGVRDECLEYALEHDERFGIWGGLSDRERRRLRRQIG